MNFYLKYLKVDHKWPFFFIILCFLCFIFPRCLSALICIFSLQRSHILSKCPVLAPATHLPLYGFFICYLFSPLGCSSTRIKSMCLVFSSAFPTPRTWSHERVLSEWVEGDCVKGWATPFTHTPFFLVPWWTPGLLSQSCKLSVWGTLIHPLYLL